jgi:hypothetical protein
MSAMLSTYVKPVVTPFTLQSLAACLRDGFKIVVGTKPRDEQLAVLFAQVRLESGNGAHCWNRDIGNIKRAAGDVGQFTCILLNEVIGGRLEWFAPEGQLIGGPGSALLGSPLPVPDGHPQTRMAALESDVEAGRFYVDFLANRKRYAGAWQRGVLAGDPATCSELLGAEGYYSAPIPLYTKTFVALFNSSLAIIRGLPHEEINQPSRNEWHNQLVLDGFVEGGYFALQEQLNEGSGRAALEADTDPSELAPESRP